MCHDLGSHYSCIVGAWVQSQATPCWICCGQSGIRTWFLLSTSVFLSCYHSTYASYTFSFIHHEYYVILAVDSVVKTCLSVSLSLSLCTQFLKCIFIAVSSNFLNIYKDNWSGVVFQIWRDNQCILFFMMIKNLPHTHTHIGVSG